MDEPHSSNWRQMFERGRPERPPGHGGGDATGRPLSRPLGGYDDGYQPSRHGSDAGRQLGQNGDHVSGDAPLSPQEITEEAALALAHDTAEYRPWVLQRGSRPVMMLHLRRHDPKSRLWMGWQLSYPHLAVEYTGDRLLSLDFGTRQFVLEGHGLDELARHLQTGRVLMVQEYAASVWAAPMQGPIISAIRRLGMDG